MISLRITIRNVVSRDILVQNNIFTAEPPRTQRSDFLFGGERPPNKKPSFMSEHAFFAVL